MIYDDLPLQKWRYFPLRITFPEAKKSHGLLDLFLHLSELLSCGMPSAFENMDKSTINEGYIMIYS